MPVFAGGLLPSVAAGLHAAPALGQHVGITAGILDPAPEPREKATRAEAAPARNKLGFKEQHELKTLPVRMAELETGIAKLREVLSDPGLLQRQPALLGRGQFGFRRAEHGSRLLKAAGIAAIPAETELAAAEERWLTLEMQREAQSG
jgi:ATP-binding cassette subfamily F protein uup